MKALISLMLFTSIAGAQEVRVPQRGEERREPRVERPEPVRIQPQPESPRQEQPPRRAEPRPEPIRVSPSVGRPDRIVIVDPWIRNRGMDPWIMMQMDFNRRQQMNRNRRPSRIEMAPLRQRWETLTPKQREKLVELRKEYREKVQKILNNP